MVKKKKCPLSYLLLNPLNTVQSWLQHCFGQWVKKNPVSYWNQKGILILTASGDLVQDKYQEKIAPYLIPILAYQAVRFSLPAASPSQDDYLPQDFSHEEEWGSCKVVHSNATIHLPAGSRELLPTSVSPYRKRSIAFLPRCIEYTDTLRYMLCSVLLDHGAQPNVASFFWGHMKSNGRGGKKKYRILMEGEQNYFLCQPF